MNSDDQIRIGNPHLDILENHIFVLSDPEDCNELKLSTITLTEGQVPVINSSDNLVIKLPNTLRWAGNVTDLDIDAPAQVLTQSASFIDEHSLYIPLLNNSELLEGQENIITINNASVIPAEITCFNDKNARLSAYVNSKKAGYDNNIIINVNDNMYNHYLAVDDITIDFSSADFNNSDNVAYVKSDEKVEMDELSIKTVNSQEQFDICYDWPVFSDNRNFKIQLPDNIYFSDDIQVQNGTIFWQHGQSDNIIEFSSNIDETEIVINGSYDLDSNSLQSNDVINISVNSLSEINTTTDNYLRTGDPEIYFQQGREMFAVQQGSGILGPITYLERNVPSAIDFIDFDINLSETFSLTFSDNTEPNFSGTGASNVSDYEIRNAGRTFRVNLSEPMSGNQTVVITNLSVDFLGQVEDYYLELNVNNDDLVLDYDYKMDLYDSNQYIRVGAPTIESSGDHVFIAGSQENKQALIESIEIKSGDIASTINPQDDIEIIIPTGLGLTWSSDIENSDQSIYLSGSAYSSGKVGDFEWVDDYKVKINILSDFDIDDNLIIDGAYLFNEGFLFIDVDSNGLESSDYLSLYSCDNDNDGDNNLADTENEFKLIVARPELSIPEENIIIVANRSDIKNENGDLINTYLFDMKEVRMVDGQGINSFPTIKAGQFIKISLASDDAFVCGESSFFLWDEDLILSPPQIDVRNIFGSASSNEVEFYGIENDGKTLILNVLDDFDAGDNFSLEGFNVYAPTCKLTNSNDGVFSYTIRNDQDANILTSTQGLYKISSPEVYSLDPQIYFEENDDSNIVTLRDIVIKEDNSSDIDMHVLDYNNINTITITLPPEASWNIGDDYLEQNGPDQGAINSQVQFLITNKKPHYLYFLVQIFKIVLLLVV